MIHGRIVALTVGGALGWSLFAFGGVHPWAYRPLLVICATTGLLFWSSGRPWRGRLRLWPPVLLVLPVILQAIPLSNELLARLAPGNAQFLLNYDARYALGDGGPHTISVVPALTVTALLFVGTGVMWTSGLSTAFSRGRPLVSTARVVLWLGVAAALIALVQKATSNGKIYWFWESQFRVAVNYYGPFVNRNHFAGWMVLALPLGMGYFLGLLADAGRRVGPTLRDRILWIGSEEAGAVLITGAALAAMAVSLVWSLSRSGIAGGTFALSILCVAALRGMRTAFRRRFAALSIVLAIGGAVTWMGLHTLALWYGKTHTLEWRFALWRDSLAPLRDFWPAGSGFNTYGQVMLLYPETDITVHAQQAHNDYLQLAIEGGLLIGVPWTIAILLLARRIIQRFSEPQDEMAWWIRMGACAGICGIALQEVTEFSLQIPAVALLFATAVAIAIHEPAPVAQRSARRHCERVLQVLRHPDQQRPSRHVLPSTVPR